MRFRFCNGCVVFCRQACSWTDRQMKNADRETVISVDDSRVSPLPSNHWQSEYPKDHNAVTRIGSTYIISIRTLQFFFNKNSVSSYQRRFHRSARQQGSQTRLAGSGPDASTSFVLHVSTSHSSRACLLRNIVTKNKSYAFASMESLISTNGSIKDVEKKTQR